MTEKGITLVKRWDIHSSGAPGSITRSKTVVDLYVGGKRIGEIDEKYFFQVIEYVLEHKEELYEQV
jgi:hypothetical protein